MGLHQGALLLPQGTHQRTHSICVRAHTPLPSHQCAVIHTHTHSSSKKTWHGGEEDGDVYLFQVEEVVGSRLPPQSVNSAMPTH